MAQLRSCGFTERYPHD